MANRVEIPCKNPWKTQCNSYVKLCVNFLLTSTWCVNPPYSHFLLTTHPHTFAQQISSVFNYLFHFSTRPTTITTNNLIERI